MATVIHFIDVGQGNMVLIEPSNGSKLIFDCNITNENEARVLSYVRSKIGKGTRLKAFICSHRDADHMRGVKKLHKEFPIDKIWDSNYPGTTTNSTEYTEYMSLRREVGSRTIEKMTREDFGRTRFRYMSSKDERLQKNANAQGIVIKVQHHRNNGGESLSSAMLPGDSDAETWRDAIMKDYNNSELSSDIMMASHHGSDSFFEHPSYNNDFEDHMKAIKPGMTVVSVGKNSHGHPDAKALRLYEKHSSGSKQGNKVFRTDKKGSMILTLHDDGGWNLKTDK